MSGPSVARAAGRVPGRAPEAQSRQRGRQRQRTPLAPPAPQGGGRTAQARGCATRRACHALAALAAAIVRAVQSDDIQSGDAAFDALVLRTAAGMVSSKDHVDKPLETRVGLGADFVLLLQRHLRSFAAEVAAHPGFPPSFSKLELAAHARHGVKQFFLYARDEQKGFSYPNWRALLDFVRREWAGVVPPILLQG